MNNSIVDLSGMSTEGLTPSNFHERTVAAGLNSGKGFRLRPTATLWSRVERGEITKEQARQIRFDEVMAQQARIATATSNEGQ